MKAAIVGAAPSSRALAPYGSAEWDIWACSPSARETFAGSRLDAWFELHPLLDLASPQWEKWAKPYLEWLSRQPCKVFMQAANGLVPNALAFPLDQILADPDAMFLTSSIAWMLAKAVIVDKAEEIGIWGVDMSTASEYEYERPGCKYWIEVARKRGIKVTIPSESDLDQPIPMYGYDDAAPVARKLKIHCGELVDRIANLEQQIATIDNQRAQLVQERAHLRGAHEQSIYIRKTFIAWSGPDLR